MGVNGGPRPEASWFKVYEWNRWLDVSSFTYTINNSLIAPAFTKLLYIFRIGKYSLWLELDDFTSGDATKTGVPLNYVYETNVTNLKAKYTYTDFPGSNLTTLYNRFEGVSGRINFWPSNYGTAGENSSLYDSDDSGYDTSNGYGSFQFFDVSQSPSQCIFAWNAWGGSGGGDLGIGNKNVGNPDWTFTSNFNIIRSTGDFSLGQVWVK
jgi:hypothetical protein